MEPQQQNTDSDDENIREEPYAVNNLNDESDITPPVAAKRVIQTKRQKLAEKKEKLQEKRNCYQLAICRI